MGWLMVLWTKENSGRTVIGRNEKSMAKNDIPKSVRCSFCGKAQENVKKIVAGPGVYICDECVELCTSIIETELYDDEKAGYTINELNNVPSPRE